MSGARIMLFLGFCVILLSFGWAKPNAYFYSYQIPAHYSGVAVHVNSDGTQTVKYLTGAEAEAALWEQQQKFAQFQASHNVFLQNIFNRFPFPFPFPFYG